MVKIYLSYFIEDSQAYTDRIYERLSKEFGKENVFRLIDAIDKAPGQSTQVTIQNEIIKSNIVLVIIHNQWISLKNNDGTRRLDDNQDNVYIELNYALKNRNCTVIPILINYVNKPQENQLPKNLSHLATLPEIRVRDDPDFHKDVLRIIEKVKGINKTQTLERRTPSNSHLRGSILVISIILIFLVFVILYLTNSNELIPTPTPSPTNTVATTEISNTSPTNDILGPNPTSIVILPTDMPTSTFTEIPTETPFYTPIFTETPSITPTQTTTVTSEIPYQTRGTEANLTETAQAYVEETAVKSVLLTQNAVEMTLTALVPTSTNRPINLTAVTTDILTTPISITPVANNTDWTPKEVVFNGVVMVLVPPGCFTMGAIGLGTDSQPHPQCFDTPFWIDKYEVTRMQYQDCVAQNGCIPTLYSPYSTQDTQPINYIEWSQARTYCQWRGGDLPTEREWEYAARGPSNWIYPWGNTFNTNNVVYFANSGDKIAPVGSRGGGASWVGAMDLAGNVEEWVSSLYFPYPYNVRAENNDDILSDRGVRGGSFRSGRDELRSYLRFMRAPITKGNIAGMRCVRPFVEDDLEKIAS